MFWRPSSKTFQSTLGYLKSYLSYDSDALIIRKFGFKPHTATSKTGSKNGG